MNVIQQIENGKINWDNLEEVANNLQPSKELIKELEDYTNLKNTRQLSQKILLNSLK